MSRFDPEGRGFISREMFWAVLQAECDKIKLKKSRSKGREGNRVMYGVAGVALVALPILCRLSRPRNFCTGAAPHPDCHQPALFTLTLPTMCYLSGEAFFFLFEEPTSSIMSLRVRVRTL